MNLPFPAGSEATGLALPVLSWLATYAVHSTLILGATWLVFTRTSLGSLRLRDAIWKTALVGGLVTASLQVFLGVDTLGGRWSLAPSASAPAADSAAWSDETLADAAPSLAPFEGDLGAAGFDTFTEVEAPVPQAASGLNATSGTNGTGATLLSTLPTPATSESGTGTPGLWARWALAAWIAIGSACLLAMGIAWSHLGRSLAGRRRVDSGSLPGLLAMLRRRGNVRRPVRLYTCPHLASPIAMGTLFPQICLPERVLDLPSDMQESILAHELAHIARCDPAWLFFARTLEMVFFFQPLNRIARRHLQHEAELLCDDWAVERTERPIVLARALAEVAGWLVGERTQLACGMVAKGAHGSALGARVSRLVDRRRREPRSPWILPAGACLLGATTLLAPGFAEGRPRQLDTPLDAPGDGPGDVTGHAAVDAARHEPGALAFGADAPFGLSGSQGDVAATTTVIVAPAEEALEQLVEELSLEFDGVLRSLAELRARTAEKDVPDGLAARLETLEGRAAALLEQKDRMKALMTLWQSTRSAARAQHDPEVSR